MSLPDDFLVPIGRTLDWVGPTTPRVLEKHVGGAAKGSREAAGLADLFPSRSYKPQAPILLVGPDGRVPILLVGDGLTEAAELEDMAQEAIDHQTEQMATTASGRGMDFDALREKHGHVRREDVDEQVRSAIAERIRHHKENPKSDPFREPRQTLGNIFPMSRDAGWVDKEQTT